MTTPAEELADAAFTIKLRADCGPGSFWSALADWLDSFESRLDDREYDYRDWNAALAVARAYLGTKEQADA